MKRSATVFLAVKEAKREPSGYCARKTGYARYLVAHQQGRPVTDYSLQGVTYMAWCAGYMDASKHRDPPPSAGGPKVHEAPGGIFRG